MLRDLTVKWCILVMRHFYLYARAYPIISLIQFTIMALLLYYTHWYRWIFFSLMFLDYALYLFNDTARGIRHFIDSMLQEAVNAKQTAS